MLQHWSDSQPLIFNRRMSTRTKEEKAKAVILHKAVEWIIFHMNLSQVILDAMSSTFSTHGMTQIF